MISSEVQRTLVKSPPELWTELSDPEALARHLGELGEIKITRTEPETLVEWEAEGTTGTVAIKASGWGTKVTLSVNRELPAPEAAEPSSLEETECVVAEEEEKKKEEDDEVPHLAPAAVEGEASLPVEDEEVPHLAPTALESEASLPTEIEPASAAEGEAAAEPEDEAAAPPEGEAAPAEDRATEAERKPAPATEAARRAAGWPSGDVQTGPAIESDLRAAEDSDPVEAVVAEWQDELEPWSAHAAEASAEESPVHEPRRGFFARLFGRRRRGAGAAAHPLFAAEPEHEEAQTEDPALEVSEEPFAEEQPVLDDEPMAEEELVEIELESVAEEEPPAEAEAGLTAEDAAPIDPEPRQQGADLASELKAAEEIAAEQVTAVLTGVLDRLGAAHHRPFSRA